MIPFRAREILGEFYYLIEKSMKKPKKKLRQRMTIESRMKILEIFGENRLEFVEKCILIKIS